MSKGSPVDSLTRPRRFGRSDGMMLSQPSSQQEQLRNGRIDREKLRANRVAAVCTVYDLDGLAELPWRLVGS